MGNIRRVVRRGHAQEKGNSRLVKNMLFINLAIIFKLFKILVKYAFERSAIAIYPYNIGS